MRATCIFVLAVAGVISPAQCLQLRGAPPSFSAEGLRCAPYGRPGAPAVRIDTSRINDNFCDCADGTDEPGTAACSDTGSTFYCLNDPHEPRAIDSAFVDDGVCDCCDGSDEPSGRCSNSCAKERTAAVADARKKVAAIREGVKKRKAMARTAAEQRRKDLASLESKKKEIKEVKSDLAKCKSHEDGLKAYQKAAPPPEEDEPPAADEPEPDYGNEDFSHENDDDYLDDEHDGMHLPEDGDESEVASEEKSNEAGSEEEVGKSDHTEANTENDASSNAQPADTTTQEASSNAEEEQESATSTEQRSEEDKQQPPPTKDTADSGTIDEQVRPVVGEGAENVSETAAIDLEPFCRELVLGDRNKISRGARILMWRAVARLRAMSPKLFGGRRAPKELEKCIDRAASRRHELEARESTLRVDIDDLEKKVAADTSALRALQSECFKKKLTQYEWEHCPFDTVKQHEHGRVIASLGSFDRIEGDTMHYTRGAGCWNGPDRTATVRLQCAANNEVLAVHEPSRCTYHMVFSTPAVCDEQMALDILAKARIDNAKQEL